MDLINKQEALKLMKLNYDDSPRDTGDLMYNDGVRSCVKTVREMKPLDVVPWSVLERYADWFCAMVSYPEFIREAKMFYKGVTDEQ